MQLRSIAAKIESSKVVVGEVIELLEQLSLHQVKLRLVRLNRHHIIVVWKNWVMNVKLLSFRKHVLKSLIFLEQSFVVEGDLVFAVLVLRYQDRSSV
jgi:hypothetical protein